MNQLTGHLRPEPHPGLPRPHPSLSRPRQSSAGQGAQRQFPFFFILIVCIIWLQGAPVEGKEGPEGLSTSRRKDGGAGTHPRDQTFTKSLVTLLVGKEAEGGRKRTLERVLGRCGRSNVLFKGSSISDRTADQGVQTRDPRTKVGGYGWGRRLSRGKQLPHLLTAQSPPGTGRPSSCSSAWQPRHPQGPGRP